MALSLTKHKKIIILLFLTFVILVSLFSKFFLGKSEPQLVQPPAELTETKPTDEGEVNQEVFTEEMYVDLKGAVVNQGVYKVTKEMRVKDVIELAGGFKEEADVKQVNLAAKLVDELVIYVPVLGEEPVNNSGQVQEQEKRVSLNRGSLDDFQTLTGIGPAKAAAIISYREEHGPFRMVEDLLQVTGIGEKTFEKIKNQIYIE